MLKKIFEKIIKEASKYLKDKYLIAFEIGYKQADKVKESIGEEGKKQLMEDLAVSKAVEFVVNEAKEK